MMEFEWKMMQIFLSASIGSFFAGLMILCTTRWHGRHTLDNDLSGAQKFHKTPVPRIGGIAFLIGMLSVLAMLAFVRSDSSAVHKTGAMQGLTILIVTGAPVLAAGLTEDVTKTVSATTRLLAAFASALLASYFLGAMLPRLDIRGIDFLMQLPAVAIIVTAISVAGFTNAINIIDGFNGLAGTTAVVILAAFVAISWQENDLFLLTLSLAGIGVAVGFLLLNFPAGRIFMGDGGAYFLGFWIVELAVLMIARNPSISAWQLLSICAYPIIEVLYSIYRKKIIRNMSPGLPDRLHLHMLVHRRFVWQRFASDDARPWIRNAMTTCSVMAWVIPLVLLSVLYGNTIFGAVLLIVLQSFIYLGWYARLVRGHWCANLAVGLGLKPERRVKLGTR